MSFMDKVKSELALLKGYGYKRAGVLVGVGFLLGLLL